MTTCLFCSKNFDRTMEGKCPYCEREHPRNLRKCPECGYYFVLSCRAKKQACPVCKVALYLPQGKSNTCHTLAAKETSERLVKLLEATVSAQYGGIEFAFEYKGERERELKFAYALVDRSRTFIKKQTFKFGVDPYEFVVEVVETMLADPYYKTNIKSFQQAMNNISKVAAEVWGKKKLAYLQNKAAQASYIDFSPMMPEWN